MCLNKNITVISLAIIASFLAGCADVRNELTNGIEEQMLEQSGVKQDNNYQQYESYKKDGNIDESNGMTIEANHALVKDATGTGSVHVTFAENPNISVFYFIDDKHDSELNSDSYLNPGDTIYCIEPQSKSSASNKYHFSEFKIYSYDSDGKRNDSFETSDGKNGIVYKIPENFSGEGLSIEPIGKFDNRILKLHDYYINQNGENNEISGAWTVNDKNYNGIYAEVESTEDLSIEYNYDNNTYFVVKTSPERFSKSNDDGSVKFEIANSVNDDQDEYSVYLKHYLTLHFNGELKKGIQTIEKNGQAAKLDNNEYLENLKYGDELLIHTNDGYSVNCLMLTPISTGDNQFLYQIPNDLNEENIDIAIINDKETGIYKPLKISNGTLKLTYANTNNGAELKSGDKISNDDEVVVTITPNKGYYISGKDIDNGIYKKKMKYSAYLKNINEIADKHEIKKMYAVVLDNKDPYGTVTYTLDGKEVSGRLDNLKEEQTLRINYVLDDNSEYVIERNSTSWKDSISNLIRNKIDSKKEEKVIPISSDIDGKTITRNQYIQIAEERK